MKKLELINDRLNKFPPKLQKLAKFIEDNYGFKSLKEACELSGLNYDSIQVMISKNRKKGRDFSELVYNTLDLRNRKRLMFVDDTVCEKALAGDIRAAELFYKRAGEIKPINKTEINFNQQNNYLTMQPMDSEPIPEESEEIEVIDTQHIVEGQENTPDIKD